ncbi:MAG: pseudouridine synthase [Oscillospiraceae bacterium]|nr:pseudouridine synthase [Oscillospiraceae bacterium]
MSRKRPVFDSPKRYYLLNKPTGCVSACQDAEHPTVLDYLPMDLRRGLFPIGRLDKNTEGLLILTDDGKLNRWLLEPEHHVEKRYLFWAMGTLKPETIAEMEKGFTVKGIPEPLRPVKLNLLQCSTVGKIEHPFFENRRYLFTECPEAPAFFAEITLTEGKRHQIKRMMEAVGCTVLTLQRIAFGSVTLEASLLSGEYRSLTDAEIQSLQQKE